MSLFKKKPQMPAQGREQVETDFEHHTIIHHLLFAYPDDYTSCGAYPDYSSPEYFSDVLAKAEEAIKSLDLDETTTEGFTEMVKLKAYQSMLSSLVETRQSHHRTALNLRSDLLLQIDNLKSSEAMIQHELDAVESAIARLKA